MKKLSFKLHCGITFFIRILLILYSNIHDQNFSLKYTDVDYKVFTDAARYITNGSSPFYRHTYRYSPILALILTPNIYFFQDYGKLLFSIVDIFIAIIIRSILKKNRNSNVEISNFCAYLWLYNPLIIAISTRGNADCLAAFLVILSLYYLQSEKCIIAGLIHGISIHFRLYPLIFSLAMYLSLKKSKFDLINLNQVKFTVTCIISVALLTGINYYFYGYKFIDESLIYHLIRKDTRHNFSVYFYLLYLSNDTKISSFQRIFNVLPPILLLTMSSIFYSSKSNLPFALMIQAFIFVTYNSVMTSQYFFWFLSLLPLCIPNFNCTYFKAITLFLIWIFGQCSWLLAAYALEFQSINTFNYIWLSSLIFYTINVGLLIEIIRIYRKN